MNAARAERRRTAWIVIGSVAGGLASALFLAMAPFAGGTDSAVTGALLTGFALGWALLFVLSSRLTSTPQRWALVPAAVLGVSGLALLVLRPGVVAMERVNWVWPPFVLALAVWLFGRTRATLAGAARWILTPVVLVLGLSAVGAVYENVASARDRDDDDLPGRTYQVDGRALHLWCVGTGEPTVVLENGLGGVSASWARVMTAVSQHTRVCAHDRAGQGWSDPVAEPRTARQSASDLHALLKAAGETGPFVLVGHSIGGPHALVYADQYPDDVAGMVLLDSTSPEQFTLIDAYPGQYQLMRRGYALMQTAAHVGLMRTVIGAMGSELPDDAARRVESVTLTARSAANARDELAVIRDLFAQARSLTTFGAHPLVVVTADDSVTDDWSHAQDKLAALSSNHLQVTAHSSHVGLLEEAAGARTSSEAIEQVLAALRNDTPVSNS